MKPGRQKAFAIVMVIAIMTMVSTAVLILADVSGSLLLDSNRAYVEASSRNLSASGLAWLRHNRTRISDQDLAKGVDLDVTGFQGSQLRVEMTDAGQCRITTACRSGSMTSKGVNTFPLDNAPSPGAERQ